jgi:dienelactone hydrolase
MERLARRGALSLTALGLGLGLAMGLALGLAAPPVAAAGEVLERVPTRVDPAARYLIYLHGAWIERHGLGRRHPRHGHYRLHEIARALAARGFIVIAEARLTETVPPRHAERIADQARRLLGRGVAPRNITIAGHSKGGMMTLAAATLLRAPAMNFVVLAGCGREGSPFRRGYQRFLDRAAALQGRILSLYDDADREAGSCRDAFFRAPLLEAHEITFSTGLGHGLFYAPRDLWIDAVVSWAGGGRAD